MKKYTNTLLAVLLSGAFIGCSSNNDTEVKEEANTTTTQTPTEEITPPPKAQIENKKMPKCYIKKGTPLTENMITVHVKCKNGNIPIDEATVTLDNTVKSVDYKGTYFSDYIGFGNLQPATTYKAVLEVVVGGKTLKDSVKIKTKEEKAAVTPEEEKVVVTPTPTPTPRPSTEPSKEEIIINRYILFTKKPKSFDENNVTYATYNSEIENHIKIGTQLIINLPDKQFQITINKVEIKSDKNYFYQAKSENNFLIHFDLTRVKESLLGSLHSTTDIYEILISNNNAKITRRSLDSFGED